MNTHEHEHEHEHETETIQRRHSTSLAFTVASASLVTMVGALGNNSGERSPPGAVEARCGSPRAAETGVVGGVGSLRLCLIGEC